MSAKRVDINLNLFVLVDFLSQLSQEKCKVVNLLKTGHLLYKKQCSTWPLISWASCRSDVTPFLFRKSEMKFVKDLAIGKKLFHFFPLWVSRNSCTCWGLRKWYHSMEAIKHKMKWEMLELPNIHRCYHSWMDSSSVALSKSDEMKLVQKKCYRGCPSTCITTGAGPSVNPCCRVFLTMACVIWPASTWGPGNQWVCWKFFLTYFLYGEQAGIKCWSTLINHDYTEVFSCTVRGTAKHCNNHVQKRFSLCIGGQISTMH